MKNRSIVSILLTASLTAITSASALTLEEYLGEVAKKHKEFQSYDVSKEVAEDRRVAGDLALSTTLTMDASYLNDQKIPQSTGGTKTEVYVGDVGLGKQFESGTYLGVSSSLQRFNVANVPPLYAALIPSNYNTSTLGFTVSQSLWKNAFGHGVRLRHERETLSARLEKEGYNLQQRQILINAESAYWDYLYQQEDLAQKSDSLDRSHKIENWLKRRFGDGISDKADFLNAQALSANRELALQMTRDQARTAEQSVRDFLELGPTEKIPALTSDFKKPRGLTALISGEGNGEVVRMDSYLASLEAKAKSAGAREAQDALRPDLVLQGAYATNAYNQTTPDEAFSNNTRSDHPTSQVGLKFTYMFDTDAKISQESISRKEALAAQLRSERRLMESASSWSELQRRYGELLTQIETAEKVNKLQLSRAKEQQLKLNRGRSITSDVVLSEEDAASSGLSLNRLRSEARKVEAQSRLFMRMNSTN
jgi:outer membrane protein TolC